MRCVFTSMEDLRARLRAAKYVASDADAEVVFDALRSDLALLVEGPPGSGKTELARALTLAAGTQMERLQCYEGIGQEDALGSFDRALQDQYLKVGAGHTDVKEWPRLREQIYTLGFFSTGPFVRALLSENPCVLLIDEIDKTDPAFEAMMFQLLEEWRVTIPKLGTIEARSIPITVLSSNNKRRLSDPLRSRCAYLYFEYPTIEQELEILKLRLGTDPSSSYPQIAGLAKALRSYRLLKPPSIREILKLAQVLRDRGCNKITPDMRDTLLPFLVKTAEDRDRMLLTHNFNRLCADAAKHAREFSETTKHERPSTAAQAELTKVAAA
jgi:MoxR-like ATPase